MSGDGSARSETSQPPDIVVTARKPKRISQCMINFLTSLGLGADNLSQIKFMPTMKVNRITRAAERRGHGAITLGNRIYVTPSQWADITNPAAGATYFEEIIHAIQWNESGAANFVLSYGLGLPFGHDNHVEAQAMGLSNRVYEAYLAPSNRRCLK
jgi:hypothetical protein